MKPKYSFKVADKADLVLRDFQRVLDKPLPASYTSCDRFLPEPRVPHGFHSPIMRPCPIRRYSWRLDGRKAVSDGNGCPSLSHLSQRSFGTKLLFQSLLAVASSKNQDLGGWTGYCLPGKSKSRRWPVEKLEPRQTQVLSYPWGSSWIKESASTKLAGLYLAHH